MTTATQTRSWQREPVGDPAPPDGPPAAPSLFPLLDWLVGVHGGKSLSTSNLWHDRPVRGGSVPSSHRGAAFDWRYEDPGKGRQYMLTNVLPDLIVYSHELNVQQIHDYVGARVWKASRSGDSSGGWARQTPGSHSGMMGAPWAQWLHVEAGEWAWTDDRPVPDKLGPVPALKDDDMHPVLVTRGTNRYDLFATGDDGELKQKWWNPKLMGSDVWSDWQSLGGQLVGPPTAAVSGERIDIMAVGADDHIWQLTWDGSNWAPWLDLGRAP